MLWVGYKWVLIGGIISANTNDGWHIQRVNCHQLCSTMATAKPTFLFFKISWCGPCKTFDIGIPEKNVPAQWPIMEADKELNSIVNLKRYEWNSMPERGAVKPLPKEYQPLVTYGPFFFLEAGRETSGKPVGVIFRGNASAQALKEWITQTLATNELFAHFKVKKRNVVPAALNHPSLMGKAPASSSKSSHHSTKEQPTQSTKQTSQQAPQKTSQQPTKSSSSSSTAKPSSHSHHSSSHHSGKDSTKSSKPAPSSSGSTKLKPSTSSSSAGQDKRLRAMKPATFEQRSDEGDSSSEEEEEQTKPKPSPHNAPGGTPSFSYNRPGTKVRLAFNAPSTTDVDQ